MRPPVRRTPRFPARRTAPVLLALLALCACRRAQGPEAAYRAFADAARDGDSAAVWDLLAERSRKDLDGRARELAARVPGTPASGRDLVLGDLSAGAPGIARVAVSRASGDSAVLAVTEEGGRQAEVEMVREGGRWRVVLPAVKPSP
jgi:hypothetical protein